MCHGEAHLGWTLEYQNGWKQRQFDKLYVYLVKLCKGEALRQLEEQGVTKMGTMRQHFVLRFGEAQISMLQFREKQYLAGMPAVANGEAFPMYGNLETKLNQLESERTYFNRNCPVHLRDGYKYCHEATLVQIVIEHIPVEYEQTIKDVRNVDKAKQIANGEISAGGSTAQDILNQNFLRNGSHLTLI